MIGEMGTLPVGGSVLAAGLLYVGTSMFVTGPLVGERTIEKSGWIETCQSELQADIEARKSPPQELPAMDCKSIAGPWWPELEEFCSYYGNPDLGGFARGLWGVQAGIKRKIEDRRLERAAAQIGSRCECAAALVAQDSAWAIHAGSLRLITAPSVKNLDAELRQALHSPRCAERG